MAPAGTRIFCGRTSEQVQLMEAVGGYKHSPLVLVISGIAGVGKTELAVRAAEEMAPSYPDGSFWIGLRTYAIAAESRLNTAQALRMLLNALGDQPDPNATDLVELGRKWRTATADRRVLLILDDVDDVTQVEALLPGGKDSAVLITSRHVLVGIDPDRNIRLQPFDRGEAEQLADAILARAGLADRAAVMAITDRYRLPLALRHICDLRVGNPGVSISELLTTSAAGLDEASAALTLSFDALTRDARQLLRRLSRYPGSLITAAIAATTADRSIEETHKLLAELYQHGLLSHDGARGYRMHDLVRDAALGEAAVRESRREVATTDDRVFRYFTAAIESAHEVLYPSRWYGRAQPPSVPPPRHVDDLAALEWLDLYYADLIAVSRRAMATSYPRAWLLIYSLEYYQRIRGYYRESIELEMQALRIAEDQKDRLGQASMHQNLGLTHIRLGDYVIAHENLETSLQIYISLDEPSGRAMVHNELAKLDRALGDLSSARWHAENALTLFTGVGNAADIGAAHRQLGILDRIEGYAGSARVHFQTAMRMYESLGQRRGIASCNHEFGLLDHAVGRHDEARSHFEAAMSLYQSLGDAAYEADTRRSIAVLDFQAGDLAAARKHLDSAMKINTRINNQRGQADVYVELGNLARAEGGDAEVRRLWGDAASMYERLNLQAEANEVRGLLQSYSKELGEAAPS